LALPVVLGSSPWDTFYPPTLNSTAWITNSSIGTYGGVFTAGKESSLGEAAYGTYDYCSMPHPRVQEYAMPAAVSNGSVKAKLVYLEYLQRHQKRTAYNLFPEGEATVFDCDDVLPYTYAGLQPGQQQPIPMYAKTYTDPTNPFVADFAAGSCQFPQLTIGGFVDGYQHGRDLWEVYGQKLGLLPANPGNSTWFRSSESTLTQDSAGAVLRGVWPAYRGSLPIHQQSSGVDTVNEGFSCSAIADVLSGLESTAEWDAHLNATAPLQTALQDVVGTLSSAWLETFDHLEDNFQSRQCNGYALPCSLNDTADCVTPTQADEVYRAGDWEWNYYWRTNPNATLYIQLVQGLFIGEILGRIEAVVNGTNSLSYSHIFVHDGDIGPVAGALGITELRWPGMAANIAFEIWYVLCILLFHVSSPLDC
jgi:acid phosphatase